MNRGACCIINIADQLPDLFTDEQMDAFIDDIVSGKVDPERLPVDFYQKIAGRLTEGVYAGYGQDLAAELIREPDLIMLNYLRENVHVFSGAKTFQQVQEIQQLFIDDMGERVPLAEFRKKARNVFQEYNKNWLDTEYISAVANARSASKWVDIQELKHILPNLRFQTVGDQRVRQAHRALNNVVLPVDHPFWDDHMTPLDWRCRCDVLQEDEDAEVTPLNQIDIPDVPDVFKFNPGKDRIVFSPAHPYFQVEKKYKPLAQQNFNLPLPEFVPPKPLPVQPGIHPMQPKNFEPLMGPGVEMSDEFWGLLKHAPELKTGANSFHTPGTISRISINVKRFETPYLKKHITAHEFGHAIHNQQKLIRAFDVDPRIEELFGKDFKASGVSGRGADARERYEGVRDILFGQKTRSISERLVSEGVLSKTEAHELYQDMADAIGAISNNRLGWGHANSYYKAGGGSYRRAEWFARIMQLRYVGNPLFKEAFPALYNSMIESGERIVKIIKEAK
jgi:SPP1 gp7 family putative phage head morphogenesis protein